MKEVASKLETPRQLVYIHTIISASLGFCSGLLSTISKLRAIAFV